MAAPGGSHPGRVGGEQASRESNEARGREQQDRDGRAGRVDTAGRPNPTGSPSGRKPGGSHPGRIGGEQAARQSNQAGAQTHQGENRGLMDMITDFFSGYMNPTPELPGLGQAMKVTPLGLPMGIVGGLRAAGVPSTPANTDPNYPAGGRDVGPNDPQWYQEGADIGGVDVVEDAGLPRIPGKIWTPGGVTPTTLPGVQQIESENESESEPAVIAAQASQPSSLATMATPKMSPLAKTVKSALGSSPSKQVA